MRSSTTVVAMVTLLALAGCSSEPAEKAAGERPAAKGPTTKAYDPAKATASLSGRVTFEGTPPGPRTVRMSADPYCDKANEGGATRQPVAVGADGGLEDVYVYIKQGLGGLSFDAPGDPVVLDQIRCGYVPKMLALRVGQPLEIRNSDATLHNVHAMPNESSGFNIGMPTQGMSAVRKFAKAEVLVRIKCDVHPWMETFVGVTDHPFATVTGESGSFSLKGLPAGEYVVEAVHAKLGSAQQTVTVADGGSATVSFSFSGG